MAVNSVGSIISEQLTKYMKNDTIELALDGKPILELSQKEVRALMRTPEFSRRLLAAEKEVSNRYSWFVYANFFIQILILLLISLVCGKYVVYTVMKYSKF